MDISIERRENAPEMAGEAAIELAVKGRIDAETGVELEHAVAEELRRGHHAIRLDCTDVSFLSSAGIRVLFNVHRAAKTAGARCLIGAASEPVARVLELTRLAPILRESRPQESQPQESLGTGGRGQTPSGDAAPAAVGHATSDTRAGRILFVGLELPGSGGLKGDVVGASAAAMLGSGLGRLDDTPSRPVPRHAFGLGLAGLADDALATIAGEMLAACGAVFHRAPQPFATVD